MTACGYVSVSERADKHTDNGCVNRYWDGLVAMPTAGVVWGVWGGWGGGGGVYIHVFQCGRVKMCMTVSCG